METAEKDACNLPLIFTEMLKNEINALEEDRLYNGIKRVIKKYSGDLKETEAIDEFTRVLLGGTSLSEVMQIARDEALNPTFVSGIMVEDSCVDTNEHT